MKEKPLSEKLQKRYKKDLKKTLYLEFFFEKHVAEAIKKLKMCESILHKTKKGKIRRYYIISEEEIDKIFGDFSQDNYDAKKHEGFYP